jgi:hypothetical protein
MPRKQKKRMENSKNKQSKNKKNINVKTILRITLAVMILLLLILTFDSILRIVFLGIFIAANFLFSFIKRLFPKIVGKYLYGLELVMFCTVLTSVSFGSFIGAIIGGLLMVINYIGEKRFSAYFPLTLLLYASIGYFAYYFRSQNIIIVGIIATIVYNLIVFGVLSLMGTSKTAKYLFATINVLFNIFLFSALGQVIYNLIVR